MIKRKMTNQAYHAHHALGSTDIKTVLKSTVAHWKHGPERKDSAVFDLGSAVHAGLLEPEKDLIVESEYKTRMGKGWQAAYSQAKSDDKILLPQGDYAVCQEMIGSALKDAEFRTLLTDPTAWKEVSIITKDPETDLDIKCRPDLYLPETGMLLDVKTTTTASPEEGGFIRECFKFNYFAQAAFYSHVLRSEGLPVKGFYFFAIEKEQPYACQLFRVGDDLLELGAKQINTALADIKKAKEVNRYDTNWPKIATLTMQQQF